jgi:TRAP-type C4-dicarboxylate transport system permease small subunit
VTPGTSKVERVADALAVTVERILALALILGIALNFINVVGRYVSGATLHGADEIEIYILIWIAFLGAAATSWRGQHLRMDILVNACPPMVRLAVSLLETAVMLAIALFVAVQSFRYVERIYLLGAVSDIARIPTWIPHSAIVISFAVIALIVIVRVVQKLKRLPAALPVATAERETQP